MSSVFDFTVKNIKHEDVPLSQFKGKVLLIVNTASQCGYTPQYTGLNLLHKELGPRGFAVLGFPCNQFGGQEPGTEKDIQEFCDLNFKIEFPLFAKIEVNGSNEAPLYKHLKEEAPGILGTKAIKWNFTKFLVGADGKVISRYAPQDTPEKIKNDILSLLNSTKR